MKVWKEIPEAPGYYVSDCGEIKSSARVITYKDGRKRHIPQTILKTQTNKCGYKKVRVSVNNRNLTLTIHRLVARAFIPNPDNKPQVNHKDGDKTNNHKYNLEWCSNSENQLHANKTGLRKAATGKDSPRFQRAVQVFKEGVYIKTLYGNKEMKDFGIDFRLVSACLRGKRKSHKGYTFKEVRND